MSNKYVKTGFYDRYTSGGLAQGELAGYNKDPYNGGLSTYISSGGFILPRRDDILIQEGGGGPRAIEAYMRLFNDSQVISAYNKIIGEIVQRDWEIVPTSQSMKDLEIAEFVRLTLNKMGTNVRQSYSMETLVNTNSAFDTFIRGLGEALILGISVGEICWVRQGEYVIPSEIKIRDPRRFQFILNEDGSISPRLITFDSPYEGIPIPLRSIIIHRHWEYTGFGDPYGSGLGRQLYSLVEFRRTLMSFWIQFADKHTTPTAVGSYELGTPEEEVNSLLTALQRLGQETAVVIPKEINIEWLQSQGRPEVYTDLINYIDQQISYVMCGETTAGQDTGRVGSYARDQISDSIRKRKAKAFSEELDETLNNTLIRWIVELNYPGYLPPTIKRNFDDLRQKDDPIKLIQLLTQMNAIGYKVGDLDWVKEKLNIPSLYVEEQPDQSYAATEGAGDSINFADGDDKLSENTDEIVDKLLSGDTSEEDSGGAQPAELAVGGDPTTQAPKSKYSLQKSIYEKSRTQKLSEKVVDKMKGVYDDVGFNRITVDATYQDQSVNKIRIDEFTTPGEIIHSAKRILNELKVFISTTPSNSDLGKFESRYFDYHQEIAKFENDVSMNRLTIEDYEILKQTYHEIYRLNRRVVFGDKVSIDVCKLGYWRYFKPYMSDV
jgi:phage gp29-like protein